MSSNLEEILIECDHIVESRYPNQTTEKTIILAAEVRRLREDRTRLLDEAAKIVEVRGKALASGDRYFSRLAVHALLDKLAADIRAALGGKE